MTQAPDPLPGDLPGSTWSPAPAHWPGDPAAAHEPTSTNAVYPPVVPWWPGGSPPVGLRADEMDVPGGDPWRHRWTGPVPNNQHPMAGYAVTGYPNPEYPWVGRPGTDPTLGAATAYASAPGYSFGPGFGTPGARQRPARPGSATAAGVLGIVYGSLSLVAALLIWALPDLLAVGGAMGTAELQSLALELFVVSTFTAVCGVVLVVGGILMFRRDRSALMFGAVGSLLLSTYWLVRTELGVRFLPWPLIFAIVPVIILVQCAGTSVVSWIRWRPV